MELSEIKEALKDKSNPDLLHIINYCRELRERNSWFNRSGKPLTEEEHSLRRYKSTTMRCRCDVCRAANAAAKKKNRDKTATLRHVAPLDNGAFRSIHRDKRQPTVEKALTYEEIMKARGYAS